MVGQNWFVETMMIRFPITGKIKEPVKRATEVPIALRECFEKMTQTPRAMMSTMKIPANKLRMPALLIGEPLPYIV